MYEYPHVWTWRWRTLDYPGVRAKVPWFGDGVDRAGQRCRIITSGGSSVHLEFENGYQVITSRRGLRRVL